MTLKTGFDGTLSRPASRSTRTTSAARSPSRASTVSGRHAAHLSRDRGEPLLETDQLDIGAFRAVRRDADVAADGDVRRALRRPDRTWTTSNNFSPRVAVAYGTGPGDGHPRRRRHLLQRLQIGMVETSAGSTARGSSKSSSTSPSIPIRSSAAPSGRRSVGLRHRCRLVAPPRIVAMVSLERTFISQPVAHRHLRLPERHATSSARAT